MPYSTISDLTGILPETELLQLADDTGTRDIHHADVRTTLETAIAEADRDIDGYVGAVTATPLSPVPEMARRFSARMAIHNLFARRPHLSIPDAVADRHKQILRTLERIAEGKIALGPRSEEQAKPGAVEVVAPPKLFGSDTWSRW
jgi:phage gp36-like protein